MSEGWQRRAAPKRVANKRMRDRRPLVYHLKVIERDTGRVVGYLGNLTARGLLLFSERQASLNRMTAMEMLLPVAVGGADRIAFEAAGVWSAPNAVPGLYSTGFRIGHISRENSHLIGETIDRFGSRA